MTTNTRSGLRELVEKWRTRMPADAPDTPRVLMREYCADELESALTDAGETELPWIGYDLAATPAPQAAGDGDWYVSEEGSVSIDFDADPKRQLSLMCKRDGRVMFAAYIDGERTHGDAMEPGFFDVLRRLATPQPAAVDAPGWVRVPVEPTPETLRAMVDVMPQQIRQWIDAAGHHVEVRPYSHHERIARDAYAAMLAALSTHPAEPDGVTELIAAATELRQRQRDYLADPPKERSNDKGRLVGVAAERVDAALAALHPTSGDTHGR